MWAGRRRFALRRNLVSLSALAIVWALVPSVARAQTVLHLHKEKEAPPSTAYVMRVAQPEVAGSAIVSPDRKNTTLVDNAFALFHSQAGDIGNGRIAAGSTFTVRLYMKKSTDFGVVYPRIMLRIVNSVEQAICDRTSTADGEITRTLKLFTLTCTTSTALTFLSTTYYELWVGEHWTTLPGSHSITVEVDVEGTLNGPTDSTATVPTPVPGSTITSISPTAGVQAQAVTINGSGFGATQGTGAVTFKGVPATVTSWSDTAIGVTVPAGASTGSVVTWVNSTPSNGVTFTVVPAPVISSISPDTSVAGQTVTLTGTTFTATQGAVTFNGTPAAISSWNDTSIVATAPAGVTTGPVVATVNGQTSNGVTFTVIPPTGPAADYYLHKEGTTGLFQLKSIGPDGTNVALQTIDLRSTSGGEFVIKEFATQPAVPNLAGVIPRGVTISFTLYMRSTAAFGTLQPRARVRLNSASGALLCEATGASGLTQTITPYTLSCTIGTQVTITNTDQIHLWVGVNVPSTGLPGNHSVKGELDIEGNTPPTYDSRFRLPGVLSPPSLTSLNPASGIVGQTVTIGGTNFGATQDLSTVTFYNNVRATPCPTCWSDTSITVAVPAGATAGPVVVSRLQASNAMTFNVLAAVGGAVTQAGNGSPIGGAVVQALQSGQVVASATTAANGVYGLTLAAGVYDVKALTGAAAQVRTGFSVASGAALSNVDFTLPLGGTVTYTYDDLNRLTTVVDGAGSFARYNYDAVGNILSIDRPSGESVAVFNFTPVSGVVGAVVTISGKGFSPDLALNEVYFNGTRATVTASGATQITAVVPSGATTGSISLIAPGGSATSAAAFTVTADSGAPTITSFSPTSGVAGTAVNVSGTHFDTDPKLLKLNLSTIGISAPTATSLTATILPGAGSGHFSLASPRGTAVSTADFFVKPDGYAFSTAPLGFTGRTTIGQSTAVSMAAGTMGLLLFDGVAGQRIGVGARNVTGSASTCVDGRPQATFYLHTPDGYRSAALTQCNGIGPYTLPVTGTYELVIGVTQTATITVFEVSEKAGTIAINQPQQIITVDTPGQTLRWTFAGVAGEPVAMELDPPVPFGVCTATTVSILDPTGATVTTFNACLDFWHSLTLPANGTYTIVVSFYAGDTGSIALRLLSP
jgi:YD repeat-containing protein